MPANSERDATRLTLATSRRLLEAAVTFSVLGFAIILYEGWQLTRIDWIAAIAAAAGLAYSFWITDSQRLVAEAVAQRDEMFSQFAVFAMFLVFYAITAGSDTSPFNAHVRQAVAFIHGHTYIDAPNYIEHAQVGHYSYQLHPPMPAFLLMPFAAIWGMDTNQTMFAIVLGAVCVALAWRMFGRFEIDLNARIWLTMFFGFGTIIWYESTSGGSWEVTMVVAVLFTLLALDELLGEGRSWLIGVWAGCAALSRYDLGLVWPIYVIFVFIKRLSVMDVIKMAPGFVATGTIYVALNLIKYHSIFDRGAFLFVPPGTQFFGFKFIPGNIAILMFAAPAVDFRFPYFHPTIGGQSILLTSPAFILALRASLRRFEVLLLWLATLIGSTPVLLFFGSGASQFGARHFVQIYPFLLVLVVMGLPRRADQLTKILIGISVVLIAFGIWHIRIYNFG